MQFIRPTIITDSILTSTDVTEADYTAWAIGTTYSAAQRCIVTTPNVHKIYESLAGGNIGHDPVVDCALATPLYWKVVSATNRWKVFDNKIGDQTSKATSMNYVLTPGIIDSIAILNMDATSVALVMTDPVEGVVYNETIGLISTINVVDWYTYFFEPIIRAVDLVKSDLAEVDLPPYLNATLSITITYAGGTAKCGEIVIGLKSQFGKMKYGPRVGITDYSTKTADDAGNYTITTRAFSKRMTCDLLIKNTIIDEIFRQLALYRATPVVWVGSEAYTTLIVFGFYKDISIGIPYRNFSVCNLEIEGLT